MNPKQAAANAEKKKPEEIIEPTAADTKEESFSHVAIEEEFPTNLNEGEADAPEETIESEVVTEEDDEEDDSIDEGLDFDDDDDLDLDDDDDDDSDL